MYHGIAPWEKFYSGLQGQTKSILVATAIEPLMSRSYREANKLLDKLASKYYQMGQDWEMRKKSGGVLELESFTILSTQVADLSKHVQALEINSNVNAGNMMASKCEWCGEGKHPTEV